jgi:hypothetical protein
MPPPLLIAISFARICDVAAGSSLAASYWLQSYMVPLAASFCNSHRCLAPPYLLLFVNTAFVGYNCILP